MKTKKKYVVRRYRSAIPREKLFPRVALVNGELEKDYRYIFDTDGHIYSFEEDKRIPTRMKQGESADGYPQVTISPSAKFGKKVRRYIHREILFSFAYKEIVDEHRPFTQFYDVNGKIQVISTLAELKRLYLSKDYQVHHKDQNVKNNQISNDNDSNLRLMSKKVHTALHDKILTTTDDKEMGVAAGDLLKKGIIDEDTIMVKMEKGADIFRNPGYVPGKDAVRYSSGPLSWKGGTVRGTGVQIKIADQVVEDYLSLGGDMQSLNETVARVAKEELAKRRAR